MNEILRKSKEALLFGKSAVVTGGTRGIGRAFYDEFYEHGWVANVDMSMIRDDGCNFQADISNIADFEEAVFRIPKILGKIDFLVLNAGIGQSKSGYDLSAQEKNRLIRINVDGTINSFELFRPLLARDATVLFLSSDMINDENPPYPIYALTKKHIDAYAQGEARAFRNLRILTLLPGPVDTHLFRNPKPQEVADQILQESGQTPKQFVETVLYNILPNRNMYPSGSRIKVYRDLVERI